MTVGKTLSITDAIAVTVGVVIGAGIFRSPPMVAQAASSGIVVLLLWLAGGAISLVGALSYAELASAYPGPGGDYRYLIRAYGRPAGFLFAWARMAVIQPGSIALIGFMVGDYATEIFRLGEASSSKYAALIVILLTGVNIAGVQLGKTVQRVLTGALLAGLATVVVTGFLGPAHTPAAVDNIPAGRLFGSGLLFVLFTYGGWNEAAYLSGEVRDPNRAIPRVFLASIVVIAVMYLLVNAAFIRGLGLAGVSDSGAVAADLMRKSFGGGGAMFISLLISLAAISTMNAIILTGARTSYALGCDYPLFGFIGRWESRGGTPVNALLVQGAVSLLLVGLGTVFRSGFAALVEYTAPVFWLFLLLGGASLFVLRFREPSAPRPFRVPLYPATPIIFCVSCGYLLYSSLAYTGRGALVGAVVLAAGLPLLAADAMLRKPGNPAASPEGTAGDSLYGSTKETRE